MSAEQEVGLSPLVNQLSEDEREFVRRETLIFVDAAQAMAGLMKVTWELFPGPQNKTTQEGRRYNYSGPLGETVALYTLTLTKLKERGAKYLLWKQYPTFNFPGLSCEFLAFNDSDQEVRLE